MRKLKRWWNDNGMSLFAQGLIGALRGFFRIQEALAPPEKQAKLRRLREQMEQIERDKEETLATINNNNPSDPDRMLAALEKFGEKYGTPETVEQTRKHRAVLQAMDVESDTLKRLRTEYGEDNVAAIVAFREYADEHPDSQLARTYLIGAMRDSGDYDGAIAVCEENIAIATASRNDNEEIAYRSAVGYERMIGEILIQKGDSQGAIYRLERMVAEHKHNDGMSLPMIYLTLGDAYQKRGAMPEAKKAWKEALRHDEYGVMKMEVAKRSKEVA